MRIINIFVFIVFLATAAGYANSRAYGEGGKSGYGTEVKKSGGANVVTPKGAKLTKKDSVTFVEGLREYTSRKFSEVEGRVKSLETENAQLKREVGDLKGAVANLKKELGALAQKESAKKAEPNSQE